MGRFPSHRLSSPAMALRPCAGVMCPVATDCVRYLHLDSSPFPSVEWLASCAAATQKERPGFIFTEFIGPPNPHHFGLTRKMAAKAAYAQHRINHTKGGAYVQGL